MGLICPDDINYDLTNVPDPRPSMMSLKDLAGTALLSAIENIGATIQAFVITVNKYGAVERLDCPGIWGGIVHILDIATALYYLRQAPEAEVCIDGVHYFGKNYHCTWTHPIGSVFVFDPCGNQIKYYPDQVIGYSTADVYAGVQSFFDALAACGELGGGQDNWSGFLDCCKEENVNLLDRLDKILKKI
jgi:hypothetical protein